MAVILWKSSTAPLKIFVTREKFYPALNLTQEQIVD
jgi:hypothetical protein